MIVALALGCSDPGNEPSARQSCDELRDAIMTSLQTNVDNGVLLVRATPCGENGVANRRDYFAERVSDDDIDDVQRDFAAACDEFAASCVGDL